eukprot:SAG11_NODE_3392_length_2477_cov_1.339781_2_plen_76_part_00
MRSKRGGSGYLVLEPRLDELPGGIVGLNFGSQSALNGGIDSGCVTPDSIVVILSHENGDVKPDKQDMLVFREFQG